MNLCFFGSEGYESGIDRLCQQAKYYRIDDNNIFNRIFVYKEENLKHIKDLDDHRYFIDFYKKGYGYWIWKPLIILNSLYNLKPDDILLYLDVGCELNYNGYKLMSEYINHMRNYDILSFRLNDCTEQSWCKMDTYKRIFENNDSFLNTEQIMATSFLLKNNTNCKEFLIENYKIMIENNYNYLIDTPSILSNHTDFKCHRHDQSIFSLLLKKYINENKIKAKLYSDHTYGDIWKNLHTSNDKINRRLVWNTLGRDYPIWAARNGKNNIRFI